jgi:diguanylate cyclase (GGDEF)-like protein
MHRGDKLHSALIAGWICLVLFTASGAAVETATDDPVQLLKHADAIKSANNDEFTATLKQLDAESARLTPAQALYLRYFKGWQGAYSGDYATALRTLDAVASETTDTNLRFRAGVTAINVLMIASRNADAYARMGKMLDLLPQVSDPIARQQGQLAFAQLYNEAGQYDLAIDYTEKLLAENWSDTTNCKAVDYKLNALFKLGKLQPNSDAVQQGVALCIKAGEPVFTNEIRVDAARLDISQGKYSDATSLLTSNYEEVQRAHYPELVAVVDSALAQAYLKLGDTVHAAHYAQRAIDNGIKNEFTEALVGAYDVLYQIAQKQGDYQAALAWHEKFAAADKGYLNLTSARILAYQMVHQQVQEKKLQVDALNKQNQVLQLKQAVSAKNAETNRLYALLLLTVLGFIAFWAYLIKRSQLRFMQIARHDGLTGIFNRQHFVDAADRALSQCKKATLDASVIIIDLDHFKLVNDTHGHAVGDQVLKCTVAACRAHLRANDLFGRLGGEEFGILMPDCVAATARQVAERIRLTVADCSGTEEGVDFPVRASFGVAGTRMSGYALRQLLIHADNALYQAKREGRDRVVVYDHTKADTSTLPPGVLDRRRG